jgi:hypothetical protein
MSSLLVFNRVYRLEIQSVIQYKYFRPSLVNCCPSNLMSGSPASPVPKVQVQTVCGGGGGGKGALSCVGDHILQEFNTLFLTRFKPPQTKT